MRETRTRLLALYLPQFYPNTDNDRWWGRGFTEWTNVTAARPLFDGHYQPHLPAHLGFYDTRVPETRAAQAALAQRFSIEGFCYWHYWFHGSRLLALPFNGVLSSRQPDFPFCLAWANETWSRRWHGSGTANEILRVQAYSAEDDRQHAVWLANAFLDPRYVRIFGRPFSCLSTTRSARSTTVRRRPWLRMRRAGPSQAIHRWDEFARLPGFPDHWV